MCSDGVDDQGAEEALWGQARVVTSVLDGSVVRASPYSTGCKWMPAVTGEALGARDTRVMACVGIRDVWWIHRKEDTTRR